jgi:hypothetical protein
MGKGSVLVSVSLYFPGLGGLSPSTAPILASELHFGVGEPLQAQTQTPALANSKALTYLI